MRTNRLFVDQALSAQSECVIEGSVAHRVMTVLRMRVGQKINLFNGQGGDFPAEILQLEKKQLRLRLSQQLTPRAESPLAITLLQSISKGQKMDFTLQKAVELGVTKIIPVIDERSSVKLDKQRIQTKHSHWHSVVISAVEQSGRNVIPSLMPAISLNECLQTQHTGTCLVLSPDSDRTFSKLNNIDQAVTLLVGSEGGLSDDDLLAAQVAGFQAVSLGPRILRTETAALVAMSICQSKWGDL